jgi:hypothetical protein
MAPAASSLTSKLNLWVKMDDSITTDGKIIIRVMSGCKKKYSVFHEITIGETCMKCATYEEQATEFFEEASALNTHAAIFKLKK